MATGAAARAGARSRVRRTCKAHRGAARLTRTPSRARDRAGGRAVRSHAEIAAALDIAEATVKPALARLHHSAGAAPQCRFARKGDVRKAGLRRLPWTIRASTRRGRADARFPRAEAGVYTRAGGARAVRPARASAPLRYARAAVVLGASVPLLKSETLPDDRCRPGSPRSRSRKRLDPHARRRVAHRRRVSDRS